MPFFLFLRRPYIWSAVCRSSGNSILEPHIPDFLDNETVIVGRIS